MAKSAAQAQAAAAAAREKARAAKFVELAEKRVTKAINSIRSVAKLSSANYVSTDEQVTRIAEVLREEVVAMHESFSRKGGATKETFKL